MVSPLIFHLCHLVSVSIKALRAPARRLTLPLIQRKNLIFLCVLGPLLNSSLMNTQADDQSAKTAKGDINVYYPIVRAPYQQIFDHIIDGMKDELIQKPALHGLQKKDQAPTLTNEHDLIVALGQRGLKAAAQGPQHVVVGAISRPPVHYPKPLHGYALTPSPRLMIGKLHELAPQVTDVYAVFNPSRSQWLVDDIKAICGTLGIELHLESADRFAPAAKIINRHLHEAEPNKAAIWLLESGFSNDNSLMSHILEQAWEKNLVVFSGNPSHIRRGLLFSMYPDNTRLGQALGQLAQEIQARHQQTGSSLEVGDSIAPPETETSATEGLAPQEQHIHILPLEHLHTGVNLRTAEHLGISISRNQEFDIIFPPQ